MTGCQNLIFSKIEEVHKYGMITEMVTTKSETIRA
jgi:hypothetical protein